MDAKRSIWEALVSSRNILLAGRVNEKVSPCLEKILDDLGAISVDSTQKIIGFCVREALLQIKASNFVSAGVVLNLIHNLPLDEEKEKVWDIDYFLSMELVAFLENFETTQSSRKIVLFVCAQLYSRYLKN